MLRQLLAFVLIALANISSSDVHYSKAGLDSQVMPNISLISVAVLKARRARIETVITKKSKGPFANRINSNVDIHNDREAEYPTSAGI